MHFSTCTDVVWSYGTRDYQLPGLTWFYFMESAIIIFFARLINFQRGEGGCEKEYSLYACDNDEKDGRPLNDPCSL
jgi:hypothetical protein